MSNKPQNRSEHGEFSATNTEFLDLELELESTETDKPTDPDEIATSGFILPTEENLSHLDVGCFVLVLRDEEYCWAEVLSIEGETINGHLNNELSTTTCLAEHDKLEITQFHRDQIKALGCDRYCWC